MQDSRFLRRIRFVCKALAEGTCVKLLTCHPVQRCPLRGDRGNGASKAFFANPLQWFRKLFGGRQRMSVVVEYHRQWYCQVNRFGA